MDVAYGTYHNNHFGTTLYIDAFLCPSMLHKLYISTSVIVGSALGRTQRADPVSASSRMHSSAGLEPLCPIKTLWKPECHKPRGATVPLD